MNITNKENNIKKTNNKNNPQSNSKNKKSQKDTIFQNLEKRKKKLSETSKYFPRESYNYGNNIIKKNIPEFPNNEELNIEIKTDEEDTKEEKEIFENIINKIEENTDSLLTKKIAKSEDKNIKTIKTNYESEKNTKNNLLSSIQEPNNFQKSNINNFLLANLKNFNKIKGRNKNLNSYLSMNNSECIVFPINKKKEMKNDLFFSMSSNKNINYVNDFFFNTLKDISIKNKIALKLINDRCRSCSTGKKNLFQKQKYKKTSINEYLSISCRKNSLINKINKETMLLKEKIFKEESKNLLFYKHNTDIEKNKFKNKISVMAQSLNDFFEGKDNNKCSNYKETVYPFKKYYMNIRLHKINEKLDNFINSSVRAKKINGRYNHIYNNF